MTIQALASAPDWHILDRLDYNADAAVERMYANV